jgi:hypothetical protein
MTSEDRKPTNDDRCRDLGILFVAAADPVGSADSLSGSSGGYGLG